MSRLRPYAVIVAICAAALVSVQAAPATPPQPVTITIDETFYAYPTTPSVTGDITAWGGIFGAQTKGTLASVDFRWFGFPGRGKPFPFQDHLFVYTAHDRYTFPGGTFLIGFEAKCNLDPAFAVVSPFHYQCAGNWQVNGGTGDYATVRGTGTFAETQTLDETSAGTGFITLTGGMHIDP
ncbi:MAG TPA: hypothetical protein VE088_01730 [Gaiellaceae bacterium]|nr:hypothetical protein [Gaiellaceae bacterium]